MLGIRYFKAGPTTHIMLMRNGRVVREGVGLSFVYYAPTALLVAVPLGSVDVPFAFEEVTRDFQSVTLQGQLTYRVADPHRLASLLDFSVNPRGRYMSEDPEKLNDRLVNATQVPIAALVHAMPLRDLLVAHQQIVTEALGRLRASEAVTMLGLEVLSLTVLSIRPTPDTAKALEAEAREQLMRQADQAIYARRNAAVEQERTIKESELATEMAVEQKRQEIRQQKMQADISHEQQRAELVSTQVENERKQAEAQAFALEAMLQPLRQTDWRVLLATSAGRMDSRTAVALAVRELAENAARIGELNISPDLLASLTRREAAPETHRGK